MDSTSLYRFDKHAKVAVARKQYHAIYTLGSFDRVHGQFNSNIAFCFSATLAIIVVFRGLRPDSVAVIIKPVDQWTRRLEFVAIRYCRVIIGADQKSPCA